MNDKYVSTTAIVKLSENDKNHGSLVCVHIEIMRYNHTGIDQCFPSDSMHFFLILSGGPTHLSTTQYVHMKMWNFLSSLLLHFR